MHHNEAFLGYNQFEESEEVEDRDERAELIEESIENFRLKPFAELNRVAKIISSLYFTAKKEEYIFFPDPKKASLERLAEQLRNILEKIPEL